MEIVSTTKFKKFSAIVSKSKAYSDSVEKILQNIASGVKSEKHPLFDGRDSVSKIAIIVMCSDRGLAGSFNSNTLKALERLIVANSGKEVSVIAVGKSKGVLCEA